MKILIAGDFCPRYRVAEKFEHDDYESVLGDVKNIISEADYSIVNFECPVTKGGEKPIEKCGSNFRCSEKGIDAVKWAGFDCVTLANNHFLDFGKEGVECTLEACEKYGVDTVGGGMNLQEASKILYKEIEGKTLAIINCCEHEFSIATENTAGSNPLNPIQQYYAIKEAQKKANYVLVIVHGGHEHYQLPSPRMQETYRFFIDAGADAVVNHHQHCYSGYETYNGKPIFYGLGNFCFDQLSNQDNKWNEGLMIIIQFTGRGIETEFIPYVQCLEKAEITLINEKKIGKHIEKLNSIIKDKCKLQSKTKDYYHSSMHNNLLLFQPYNNKLLNKLYLMHILPSVISSSNYLSIWNHINCESHRDKLTYVLNTLTKQ